MLHSPCRLSTSCKTLGRMLTTSNGVCFPGNPPCTFCCWIANTCRAACDSQRLLHSAAGGIQRLIRRMNARWDEEDGLVPGTTSWCGWKLESGAYPIEQGVLIVAGYSLSHDIPPLYAGFGCIFSSNVVECLQHTWLCPQPGDWGDGPMQTCRPKLCSKQGMCTGLPPSAVLLSRCRCWQRAWCSRRHHCLWMSGL